MNDWMRDVMQTLSGMNPQCEDLSTGGYGLMQLTPQTLRLLGIDTKAYRTSRAVQEFAASAYLTFWQGKLNLEAWPCRSAMLLACLLHPLLPISSIPDSILINGERVTLEQLEERIKKATE